MKVRTLILFACMIVVPGLAMFSHKVPADVRAATRSALWDPILAWANRWPERSPAGDPAASLPPAGRPLVGPPGVESGAGVVGFPAADVFRAGSSDVSGERRSVGDAPERLARLGATAVECRPLDPISGTQVASCRIAMDATGQLHRVFQAAGASPEEAVSALVAEVERWRDRLAAHQPQTGTSGASLGF